MVQACTISCLSLCPCLQTTREGEKERTGRSEVNLVRENQPCPSYRTPNQLNILLVDRPRGKRRVPSKQRLPEKSIVVD